MHQDEPYEEGDQVEGAGIHQKLASEDSILSTQKLKDVNLKHEDMPTDDDLETFRIFFELFDRDRSGYIDGGDLAAISAKLGKNPTEVFNLIGNFDTNQDGKVSFGEFVQSLWYLQKMDDQNDNLMVSQSMKLDGSQLGASVNKSSLNINIGVSQKDGIATEVNS